MKNVVNPVNILRTTKRYQHKVTLFSLMQRDLLKLCFSFVFSVDLLHSEAFFVTILCF